MAKKPTYEELERRIKKADKKALEQKQAAEAFARKNAELNSFINNISDMAWVKDADSRFIAVNRAFGEAVGMEAESLINHTCKVCFTEEEAEKFREDDLKVMEDRKQKIIEEKIIDSQKNEVWLETIKSPILDEPGKVIGTVGIARDINKRRQMEEKLSYKTVLLEAQSQTSIEGILVVDSKGNVVSFNERMREMWNVPQEIWDSGDDENLLKHAITLLKNPDEFLEKVRHLYAHKDERSRDEIEFKDGRYFDRYSSPLIDSTSKYHGRIWFFSDITNRKKAEQALEKLNLELEDRVEQRTTELSKANTLLKRKMDELKQKDEELRKYQFMIESAHDAIFFKDLRNRYISANDKTLEAFGLSREDVIGKNDYELMPDQKEAKKNVHDDQIVFESGKPTEVIKHMTGADGKEYWFQAIKVPQFDNDGKVIGLVGIARDITKLKQVEEALRESEEKYRHLFNNAQVGLYRTRISDGKFVEANDALAKMFGYEDRTDILDAEYVTVDNYVDPGTRENLLVILREHGEFSNFEARLYRKDGSVAWFRYSGRIYSEKGYIEGVAADITEEKRLETELQQSQKMEAIGTLSGGIAHDFNNILGIIIGNTELAMDDVPEWNPAHFNLEEIKTASIRAKDIVRQLLSFSRKTACERKPIKIIPIIKDSLKFLRATIPTSIDIRQDIQATDDTILADPTQIHQIMINLCTNASHAMETEGTIEVEIEDVVLDEDSAVFYTDLNPDNYVKVTVSDTGQGIAPDAIDRIFDPYFTTKEVGKGSGMGLSVVHGIVKSHGGAIFVESELGKGTTFSVLFPVIEKQADSEAETDEKLPTGNERILFVDDEESMVYVGRYRLERLGYQVETQTNPAQALKLFQANPDQFDLVITDMTMPQMTGDMLVKKILKIRPDMPTILCTGFSEKIDEERSKELGISAYIEKPLNKRDLAKLVRKVLDEK